MKIRPINSSNIDAKGHLNSSVNIMDYNHVEYRIEEIQQ